MCVKLVELLRIFGKPRLEQHLSELVNQRETVDCLVHGLYNCTDSEVLEHWRNYVQSELGLNLENLFPIKDWLRCLNKVLEVATGINASIIRELMGYIFPQLAILTVISIFPRTCSTDSNGRRTTRCRDRYNQGGGRFTSSCSELLPSLSLNYQCFDSLRIGGVYFSATGNTNRYSDYYRTCSIDPNERRKD